MSGGGGCREVLGKMAAHSQGGVILAIRKPGICFHTEKIQSISVYCRAIAYHKG